MSLLSLPKVAVIHAKVLAMKRKGIRTDRHLVVIESDDWGSIRVPSVDVAIRLQNKGVALCSPTSYDLFDTLETNDDLTCLMEVLDSVRDKNGKPAKMTLNYVMANPDFEKIKDNSFNNYYYERFTETYKRYQHCDKSFKFLLQGKNNGLFQLQFHSREHLNVPQWMRSLQKFEPETLSSFEEGCFSLKQKKDGIWHHFLEAYNAENEDDCVFVNNSIADGLNLFEEIFGFRSTTMIAPCYTWDTVMESTAARAGVKGLQGSARQRHSQYYITKNRKAAEFRWIGERNENGQLYTIRNCAFEPSDNAKLNMDNCLHDIAQQFEWKHPAIICSHRQNYIGELVKKNRDNNLRDLKTLLNSLIKKYPDVEFISSDELMEYVNEKYND